MENAELNIEKREHKKYRDKSRFGKSTCKIICPFCDELVTAYIWSLAGSGKKCKCGAIHTSFGISIKKVTNHNNK